MHLTRCLLFVCFILYQFLFSYFYLVIVVNVYYHVIVVNVYYQKQKKMSNFKKVAWVPKCSTFNCYSG